MRRVTAITFVLVVASVGAVTGLLSRGAAAAVVTNERFTTTGGLTTCSGETITVEGEVHLLSRVTQDASGALHLGSTITTLFRGVGVSGERYIGPSHQTTQLVDNPTGATTHTETFHFNLIRLGESGAPDDLHTGAVFHFTLDANGRLTSSKFTFTAECG